MLFVTVVIFSDLDTLDVCNNGEDVETQVLCIFYCEKLRYCAYFIVKNSGIVHIFCAKRRYCAYFIVRNSGIVYILL